MIVFISYPIFDEKKRYRGFVGSAIYLKEKNVINQLLSTNETYRKSYMYVIDKNDKIIFHPDHERIGEIIKNNTGLDYIKKQNSGKIRLINSRGVDNLAGFSHVKTTNWIIVSQQPTKQLLKQANSIIYKVSAGIFIFYLLIFYVVWKCSFFIASPLHKLANMASSLHQPEASREIKNINPWYYEIVKFKRALLLSVHHFSKKMTEMDYFINTDPLTGLMNRRGMHLSIDQKIALKISFSILLIDIDFFKRVNDTYGHAEGDLVLKNIAEMMQKNFRKDDVCCRYGGEVADLSEDMRSIMSAGVDDVIQRIAGLIDLGKQDQSIQADTEAFTLAQVLYQMWLGAALLSKLQKDKTPLHQALRATKFLLKSEDS